MEKPQNVSLVAIKELRTDGGIIQNYALLVVGCLPQGLKHAIHARNDKGREAIQPQLGD